jgi:type VII secretion protein EccB
MEHAIVRRDVRMIDEPMRAQARSLLTGCVLAAAALAGCAVLAFVRPADALGDAPIVMVKESGALYVRVGDVLHPALNLASARLIVGSPADAEVIKQSELRNARRGALLGIPGAPASVPEPLATADSQWTVCDGAVGTTVIGGPLSADAGATPLSAGRTMVVRARAESVAYLLYDGLRARVDLSDPAVVTALRLDAITPTEVSSAALNAIPETAPIAAPDIPDAGRRGPSSLGGLPVGSVVRVVRADADELFVVLSGGVQRVGRTTADIIRFGNSVGVRDLVTVAADAITAAGIVEKLSLPTLPDAILAPVRATAVCAHWQPPTAGATERTEILAASKLPIRSGHTPVALAQADGTGPNVDAVYVPPGRCFFVESTHRYLVTDTGVRFGIESPEAAAALGLPEPAAPAPWRVVKLLADGGELGRSAALVAHDGIASDRRGVVSPPPQR